MKTTLRILTILLALCGVRAQAAYSITVSTSLAENTMPGRSGQSYFDVSFSGGSFTNVNKNLWAVDTDSNPLTTGVDSPFSSLTIDPSSTLLLGSGKTYSSSPTTYRLVVDWTVASNGVVPAEYGIYFNLIVNQPNGVRANAGATDIVNIGTAAVPEPSQTLAGTVVLGCGLLLGIGRRQFKRLLA